MTQAWWDANIHGSASKLLATCRECGWVCETTAIHRLQQGRAFGCFCNRSVPWAGEVGRARILQILSNERFARFDVSAMTPDWWNANIHGKDSKLLVTCRDCDLVCDTTSVKGLQKGHEFRCACNGLASWAGEAGRSRVMRILSDERFARFDASSMTQAWWDANVSGQASKLIVTCRDCGWLCDTTCIASLQQGHEFRCVCNGCASWAGEAGRSRIMRILSNERFARYDVSAMTPEWWDANVCGGASKLLATCRDCGWVCNTTCVQYIQHGRSFGCACKNKTEALLLRWLKQAYGEDNVQYQVKGCVNHPTNRPLPFDYSVIDPVTSRCVLLELDGPIGHFGKDWHRQESTEQAERDFIKEQWALSQGCSVVRVLQKDVWLEHSDWRGHLKQSISSALASSFPSVFYPRDAPEYTSGIYAELRSAAPSLGSQDRRES
jgi:uncharacterized protein YggL (DUF469 family)